MQATWLGIQHFPCIAHTLQLSIYLFKKDWIYPEYNVSWDATRNLCLIFKKSTKETYKLREKRCMLKLPAHALVQDCVTCWNSTWSMLMEQQAAIAAVLIVRYLIPEGDNWALIESLVSVLTPF